MIGIVYNDENKLKMENELSSILFQMVNNIELIKSNSDISKYDILITDSSFNYSSIDKKIILIIDDINQNICINNKIIAIQYASLYIKHKIEKINPKLKYYKNVVINCIPKQKLEIKPKDDQDATIYFHGEDKPENMVNEMFELDTKTYYEIQFYNNNTKEIPSLKHRLSWNVTTNENLKGIIQYKIIKEIENGSLPILLKENMPEYFFAYPFYVTIDELKDNRLLVKRIKEISSYISKISKSDFKMLANSIYNSIYINENWKVQFYKLCIIIKDK